MPLATSLLKLLWAISFIVLFLQSILSTSLLGIIPGDPKLEDYYTQDGHGRVLHINASQGHMVAFRPLI